jgi:hypothetical protein
MGGKIRTGAGGAIAALLFAVLYLTVFTLISYAAARNAKAAADREAALVKGYYEADARAGLILAEIAEAGTIPASVRGVEIAAGYDEADGARTAEFSLFVAEGRELYVKAAFYEDSLVILSWLARDAEAWEADDSLPVWPGEEGDFR